MTGHIKNFASSTETLFSELVLGAGVPCALFTEFCATEARLSRRVEALRRQVFLPKEISQKPQIKKAHLDCLQESKPLSRSARWKQLKHTRNQELLNNCSQLLISSLSAFLIPKVDSLPNSVQLAARWLAIGSIALRALAIGAKLLHIREKCLNDSLFKAYCFFHNSSKITSTCCQLIYSVGLITKNPANSLRLLSGGLQVICALHQLLSKNFYLGKFQRQRDLVKLSFSPPSKLPAPISSKALQQWKNYKQSLSETPSLTRDDYRHLMGEANKELKRKSLEMLEQGPQWVIEQDLKLIASLCRVPAFAKKFSSKQVKNWTLPSSKSDWDAWNARVNTYPQLRSTALYQELKLAQLFSIAPALGKPPLSKNPSPHQLRVLCKKIITSKLSFNKYRKAFETVCHLSWPSNRGNLKAILKLAEGFVTRAKACKIKPENFYSDLIYLRDAAFNPQLQRLFKIDELSDELIKERAEMAKVYLLWHQELKKQSPELSLLLPDYSDSCRNLMQRARELKAAERILPSRFMTTFSISDPLCGQALSKVRLSTYLHGSTKAKIEGLKAVPTLQVLALKQIAKAGLGPRLENFPPVFLQSIKFRAHFAGELETLLSLLSEEFPSLIKTRVDSLAQNSLKLSFGAFFSALTASPSLAHWAIHSTFQRHLLNWCKNSPALRTLILNTKHANEISQLPQNGTNLISYLKAALLLNQHSLAKKIIKAETFQLPAAVDELCGYKMNLPLLHIALLFSSEEVLELMLKRWPILAFRRDKNGQTALHYAARMGDPERIKLLLRHGAYAYTRDYRGNTAKHLIPKILSPTKHSMLTHLLAAAENDK